MNWSQAFARQAASDLDAYDTLANDGTLPSSHALHYLQMACEKLCKAAMIAAGTDPLDVQASHAHVAKQLPILVRAYISREARRVERDNWIVRAVRPLARKIELLSPAVTDGGRSPQNTEYPWLDPSGVGVIAPADHNFQFSALFEPSGATVLKVIRQLSLELQR